MTTKTYVSVSSKAKNIRKAYCSVNGQAKPIKRIYASVGGQAKIIYDTVVVSYVNDNGLINNSTVSSSERIARHSKATKKDNKHWYKSDGTEWNFDTGVDSSITLYEAVYSSISTVTMDGSHYVPTDVKINRDHFDIRGYNMTPSDITVQRRVFSIYGNPTVEMYINGSTYWNYGLGNSSSNITWSARSNNVKAKLNEKMWFRINLTGSNHYSQVWTNSSTSGSWASVTAVTQNTTNAALAIGWSLRKGDKPFKGTMGQFDFSGIQFNPYQRKKGGSTVQGYACSSNNKFYPLST